MHATTTATTTATVRASVNDVWKVLSDHAGMTDWAPGLRATLVKAGDVDANGVGAVRRIKAPGPMPAIVEEITVFEAPRRLGYKAIAGVPLRNYHGDVQLRATAGGTEIVCRVSADQRVPVLEKALAKILSVALLGALVRQVR